MDELLHGMFKEIFAGGALESIVSAFKLNPQTSYPDAWKAISTIYNDVMVPVALGLMIIWLLVKFMEKASSEQVTFEQLFMLFVKLIAAKFLIDHGLEIFTNLWSLGISVVNDAAGLVKGGDKASFPIEDLWQSFTGVGWDDKIGVIKGLGVMCQLLIPWLVSKIMIACAYFIAYSRLLEMMLRMLASPIALSDFMSEGLHGAGWRYLKTFLAICLQGVLIVLIARFYSLIIAGLITGTAANGFWEVILQYFAFSFAAIALMFKSLSLSKELVGVH